MKAISMRTGRRLAIVAVALLASGLLPTTALAWFEGSIAKTADRTTAGPADVVTYTLTVTSRVPTDSDEPGTVRDVLPIGLTFVSAPPGCTNAGQEVTCTFGPPAEGQSVSFPIQARVEATAPPGPLCNTATMQQPKDTTPSDNSSTACVTIVSPPPPLAPAVATPPAPSAIATPVTPPAARPAAASRTRLSILKTVAPGAVVAGSSVVYTIVVKNAGSVAAKSVQVCDTLPDGVTVPNRAGGALRNGQICWTVATLGAGKTITYRLTAVVDRDRAGTVVNSVCAKGGNTTKVCAKVPVIVTRAAPPRKGVAGVTG